MKRETIDNALSLLREIERTSDALNGLEKLADKCRQIQESPAMPHLKRMELCRTLDAINDVDIDGETRKVFENLYLRILGAIVVHVKVEAEKLEFHVRMLNNKFEKL